MYITNVRTSIVASINQSRRLSLQHRPGDPASLLPSSNLQLKEKSDDIQTRNVSATYWRGFSKVVGKFVQMHAKHGQVVGRKARRAKLTPRVYLARIPIAGLHNFLYAHGRKEKMAWAFILLLAAAITVRFCIPTVAQFMQFTTVLEITHQTEPQVQYPTVYVCSSSGVNGTYFTEKFNPLLPLLAKDPRIIRMARRVRLSVDDLFYFTLAYITHPPQIGEGLHYELIPEFNQIVYKAIQLFGANWPGYNAFYDESVPPCDAIITDCALNRKTFPCCAKNKKGIFAGASICYPIDVSTSNIIIFYKFGFLPRLGLL